MPSISLILEVLLALLKFPAELGAFVRLISKSPEEKRQEISQQVNAWLLDSATNDKPGDEVEEPKWEK